MNIDKRKKRAKLKAKENRIRRSVYHEDSKPGIDYKWDGEQWIKLIPYWVKGLGQAYKTEVMPIGFEPPI